jgi:hypothetical protein
MMVNQFFRVEIEGALLIRHWDTDKFYLFYHVPNLGRAVHGRPESRSAPARKVLSVYRYSW